MKRIKRIELQRFAEGGDGTAATATAESTGVTTVDAAQTGREQEDSDSQDDTADGGNPPERASFEDLIKGKYKKEFDEKIHRIIGARTARYKGVQEQLDKANSVMDLVAHRYGVDVNDIDALTKAIENDTSYYEDEALERGMTVDQLRQLKAIERENENLKRTIERDRQQNETDRIYNQWMEQAEAMSTIYPDFDFMTETQNDDFTALLRNGIDVQTAYEVIHKDEIIQGAMALTAKTVKEKVTNDIRANGNRASENGTSNGAGVVYKKDVNSLTKADREEIERRIARGEHISFG